jgi:hypothetical protein
MQVIIARDHSIISHFDRTHTHAHTHTYTHTHGIFKHTLTHTHIRSLICLHTFSTKSSSLLNSQAQIRTHAQIVQNIYFVETNFFPSNYSTTVPAKMWLRNDGVYVPSACKIIQFLLRQNEEKRSLLNC